MQYALRAARDKANGIQAHCRESGSVILSADTVVVAKGEILGKPRDSDDARRMIRLLSAGAHDVHTAVVIRRGQAERSAVATTRVWFQPLDESEISWYVESGEPDGKAGAYGIQGRAARFIERITVHGPTWSDYQSRRFIDCCMSSSSRSSGLTRVQEQSILRVAISRKPL